MKRFLSAVIALTVMTSPAIADRYSDAETAYLLGRFDTARRLLLPMAQKGDKRAQYLLGRQYQLGQGVRKDPVQAYVWYSRAAKQGHAEAGLFKHLLVSRWKMTPTQVAKAEDILAGKKSTTVASVRPNTRTASPPPARKAPATNKGDDFGPLGPDPRGPGKEADPTSPLPKTTAPTPPKAPTAKRTPTTPPVAKTPVAKTPAAKKPVAEPPKAKLPATKKPVTKPPVQTAPKSKPTPRATAKLQPKRAVPKGPTDEEIMREEIEADRRAALERRRRQQAAERREIEARRRAEALRREAEARRQESRIPHEDDSDPPTTEQWETSPSPAPYTNRRYNPPAYRPYYRPPARVYAPPIYRDPARRVWRNNRRYYNYWYRQRWKARRNWRMRYPYRPYYGRRRY